MFQARGFSAVTVAEIAHATGVSVQTIFNHFATKEELFFAGRVPWVEGPAEAVRSRGPQRSALTALRSYLVDWVRADVLAVATEEHRRFVATLTDSPALCVYERELYHEAVTRLTIALMEAGDQGEAGVRWCGRGPVGDSIIASLTASVWLAAVRALLLDLRRAPPPAPGTAAVAAVIELAERILDGLQNGLGSVSGEHGPTSLGVLAQTEASEPAAAPRQPAARQRPARQMALGSGGLVG